MGKQNSTFLDKSFSISKRVESTQRFGCRGCSTARAGFKTQMTAMMTPMCSRTTQLRFCCQTKTQPRFQWMTFFLGDPPLFRKDSQKVRPGSMFSAVSVFFLKQTIKICKFYVYSFIPTSTIKTITTELFLTIILLAI